jgi:hypothetical protein
MKEFTLHNWTTSHPFPREPHTQTIAQLPLAHDILLLSANKILRLIILSYKSTGNNAALSPPSLIPRELTTVTNIIYHVLLFFPKRSLKLSS